MVYCSRCSASRAHGPARNAQSTAPRYGITVGALKWSRSDGLPADHDQARC